jgi:hypothetical protein
MSAGTCPQRRHWAGGYTSHSPPPITWLAMPTLTAIPLVTNLDLNQDTLQMYVFYIKTGYISL